MLHLLGSDIPPLLFCCTTTICPPFPPPEPVWPPWSRASVPPLLSVGGLMQHPDSRMQPMIKHASIMLFLGMVNTFPFFYCIAFFPLAEKI